MSEYHKINSIFKRNPETKFKTFLPEYSEPIFEFLAPCRWEVMEKIDGTNIRVIVKAEGLVEFRGRTDKATIPDRLFGELCHMWGPLRGKLAEKFPEGNVVFYGEGFGEGIQKGGGRYGKVQFAAFDVLYGDTWCRSSVVDGICGELGVPVAPRRDKLTLEEACWMCQKATTDPTFMQSKYGPFQMEGFVLRPTVELTNHRGSRVITKVKVKDFILEKDAPK